MEIESLKFPVGRFSAPKEITAQQLEEWVGIIEEFPALLKTETYKLSEEQLDTPYRPEGWTVRQVVHHCADSHMNSLIRLKLALTEDQPTIKPYFEERWAELLDKKINHCPDLHRQAPAAWPENGNLLRFQAVGDLEVTEHLHQ